MFCVMIFLKIYPEFYKFAKKRIMPVISMFYGIIIRMFFFDDKKHHLPHIHVEYQGDVAVVSIETAEIIAGNISAKKFRLVQAWIEIHQEELLADWKLASEGKDIFKIKPLE